MKYCLFALLSMLLAVACSTDKVTKITIANSNPYSIDFIVKANNISHTIENIAPGETKSAQMVWTHIEKKEGQWFLFVRTPKTGTVDSFAHGYFRNGELSNYLDAESMGEQLKVRITE